MASVSSQGLEPSGDLERDLRLIRLFNPASSRPA